MKIEKLIPNPSKPHAPFVRLLLDDGTAVEFMIRDEHYKSLSAAAKRLTYVLECKEYHAPEGPDWEQRRNARRKIWDDDDKAKAAAEKAAEEARFIFKVTGVTADKEGSKHLQATVQHHGRTAVFTAPYTEDKAVLEASLREAFAKWETEQLAREAFLASMSQTA